MNSVACLLGLCLVPLAAAEISSYPRPDLLIEPADLAKAQATRPPIILDVRSQADYEKGHVPGALRVDHDQWKKAFAGGDAAAWGKRIGLLGIKPDSTVVAYDDKDTNLAARIWWILRYWGVSDARLLNGGWQGWNAAGRPVDKAPAQATPSDFVATPHAKRLATMQQLLQQIRGGQWQIVDARSEGEYCGIDSHGNKKAGAIPGAKHLDWVDLIDKKTHRFKPAEEIRRLFHDARIDLARPSAAYCQSGGRASVMAFAMELMGANEVRNYYGSWHEWGNAAQTPVMKPAKPK
jgi:thiosulfate/3-mercaptopyruvate sulfurtransferase